MSNIYSQVVQAPTVIFYHIVLTWFIGGCSKIVRSHISAHGIDNGKGICQSTTHLDPSGTQRNDKPLCINITTSIDNIKLAINFCPNAHTTNHPIKMSLMRQNNAEAPEIDITFQADHVTNNDRAQSIIIPPFPPISNANDQLDLLAHSIESSNNADPLQSVVDVDAAGLANDNPELECVEVIVDDHHHCTQATMAQFELGSPSANQDYGRKKKHTQKDYLQKIGQEIYANQCKLCDKKFFDRSNLIRHQRIHTGEKCFQCDMCPQSCNQKSNLIKHQQRKHKVVTCK